MKHVIHNLDRVPKEIRWNIWQHLITLQERSEFPKFIGKRKVSFWDLVGENGDIVHVSIEKMKTQYTYRIGYEKH